MDIKNKTDVLEMMTTFQKSVLDNKPSQQDMYQEVRMMRFKIKPVTGDISMLNWNNNHFIEILWSLGKMDEFFQTNSKSLTPEQKGVFMRVFDDMYKSFQDELNAISIKQEHKNADSSLLEMEIFKDKPLPTN